MSSIIQNASLKTFSSEFVFNYYHKYSSKDIIIHLQFSVFEINLIFLMKSTH